ncbi:MAG: hypothetical protein EA351_08855 [Gemmatimonadales bacterium]|nr:MAG: hypothetical protein EA351_08855 [Gemmatimonadales bacterium]
MALLVLVFVGGMVVGVALDRSVADAAPVSNVSDVRQVAPEVTTPLREGRGWVIDQIELNEDQRAEVEEVIMRWIDEMNQRVQSCEASYQEVIDGARAEVRERLTDEQRAEFDAVLAEQNARDQ